MLRIIKKCREPEEGLFDALPILRQKHDDKLKLAVRITRSGK
jgi:hypothetical protein